MYVKDDFTYLNNNYEVNLSLRLFLLYKRLKIYFKIAKTYLT